MKILILTLILTLILVLIKINSLKNTYYKSKIDFYVITLRNIDRINNINNQEKIFNINIAISDAVNGTTINLYDYVNRGILDKNFILDNDIKRSKEIGCYLSHIQLLKYISSTFKKKYSVIFEDDFIITLNNKYDFDITMNNLVNTLSNINYDFDIVFLGNTFYNKGDHIINNIYNVDITKTIVGLFGYLVVNKNINKIVKLLEFINKPLDIAIQELIYNKKINALIVYPNIVSYNELIPSTIIVH